jgi:hypothetical protein
VMHIREGAKALRKKKGWEKAKLEWIESQAKKVWERPGYHESVTRHAIGCWNSHGVRNQFKTAYGKHSFCGISQGSPEEEGVGKGKA